MQVNSVHGEFLGIFQKHQVCLGWGHCPGKRQIIVILHFNKMIIWIPTQTSWNLTSGYRLPSLCCSNFPHWLPVCAVQLHHLILQLFALSGGQAQITYIILSMELWVILSELWLGCVGAQHGQCDKGTGKNSSHDVLPQLDTQKVPGEDVNGQQLAHLWRFEEYILNWLYCCWKHKLSTLLWSWKLRLGIFCIMLA